MLLYYQPWMFYMLFYMIFGTNQPRAQCQFLFFPLVFEFYRKGIPNKVQLTCQFLTIFYGPKEDPGAKELGQEIPRASTRVGGNPPPGTWACLVAPSGTVSRWFFFPKIIYIPKKSPSVFIPFGLRLIWIFCETKNMQQIGTGTGHWINMLVPKII